jgi:hypothetical protein
LHLFLHFLNIFYMKKLLFLLLFGVSAFGQKQPTGGATQGTSTEQFTELQLIKAILLAIEAKIIAAPATGALQTAGNASLTTIATNSGTQSTAALQTSGNASLTTIATNSGTQSTAALQTSGNASLTSMDSKTPALLAVIPPTATNGSPIRLIPVAVQTGASATVTTAYTTSGNVVTVTNVRHMIIENMSATTDATFIHAGQTYTLGSKSSGNVNPSQRVFTAFYDQNTLKYSPMPATTVNAASSNVFVTLISAQ